MPHELDENQENAKIGFSTKISDALSGLGGIRTRGLRLAKAAIYP
jgi:hypothetical protein